MMPNILINSIPVSLEQTSYDMLVVGVVVLLEACLPEPERLVTSQRLSMTPRRLLVLVLPHLAVR